MNHAASIVRANPFPGLRPFREDEEYLFFGRENQVDAMVDKLADTHFLAVVGREDVPLPATQLAMPPRAKKSLKERFKLAWKNIRQLDEFCKAAPRSVARPSR